MIRTLLNAFDLQGMIVGAIMCSLGLFFLQSAGLVSGQLAGASLLLSYATAAPFGVLFFCLSAPLFVLGWWLRGPVFTLRSLGIVLGISLIVPLLGEYLEIARIHPVAAALLGGMLSGIGLIVIFRHNASPGGASIVALLVEQRFGIKAGWFQLGVDVVVFAAAATVLDLHQLILSFLGAALTNLMIAWNFRIDQSQSGTPD